MRASRLLRGSVPNRTTSGRSGDGALAAADRKRGASQAAPLLSPGPVADGGAARSSLSRSASSSSRDAAGGRRGRRRDASSARAPGKACRESGARREASGTDRRRWISRGGTLLHVAVRLGPAIAVKPGQALGSSSIAWATLTPDAPRLRRKSRLSACCANRAESPACTRARGSPWSRHTNRVCCFRRCASVSPGARSR
jgi:hypothetical protein